MKNIGNDKKENSELQEPNVFKSLLLIAGCLQLIVCLLLLNSDFYHEMIIVFLALGSLCMILGTAERKIIKNNT